ncbi:MAG TPA: alkaline phosphatase family protein [Frateuria sp.]|uniref:alkaline phosphatase family protein n=1 Tax=Frateuria sp. TaxID=2211372 RepID=UPI002D805603|nr:alkaline phosphatase family protein [Frateuria sp.]HET6807135.1 alkaline phosphatase family protein [Frateuria sp.]
MTKLLRLACLSLLALVTGCSTPATTRPDARTPLLLVSIDGFRADYLDRGDSPTLQALAAEGVRGDGLQPSFPSLTFPNHYSLVTGRYPDHHGIVDNAMTVPGLGRFTLANRAAVSDGRWWDQAEPIWVSADRQGVRTATMFWPGSEAPIRGRRPDHWLVYDGDMPYDARVDQALHWLDLPAAQRPGFLTLYFEAVDTAGHYHGPDSAQTDAAIAQVDHAIARLVAGLRQRGLYDRVNLIVLADHGMAATPPNQRIFLDDLVDPSHMQMVSEGAIAGIVPAPGHEDEVAAALLKPQPHMQCWRKADIPPHLHYGHNERVPPLFCLARVGWLITRNRGTVLHHGKAILGEHGFDNADPRMRALFVAHGPAFRSHARMPVFPNVDVYPLMTHLLGIRPQPGDGHYADVADMLVPAAR